MTSIGWAGIVLAAIAGLVVLVLYRRSDGAKTGTRNPVVVTVVVLAAIAAIAVGILLQQR